MRRTILPLVLLLPLAAAACIHTFSSVEVNRLGAEPDTVTVSSPVKAHLRDGSVVVFRSGVAIRGDTVRGWGERYGLRLEPMGKVDQLTLDQLVGMESYRERTDAGGSMLASTLATIGGSVLTVAGLVAIACIADPKCFGSCPTVYTQTPLGYVLEAEAFSYSIAPLLEMRDVDLLGTRADSSGRVQLEVRNEALETHYLNHLELIEVSHGPNERAVPDGDGQILVVGEPLRPSRAQDRAGRDVSAELHPDGVAYATAEVVVKGVSEQDFIDWIDLSFPLEASQDSAAVVFRLRNSLLNTVLFYDFMLGRSGARSLDWLGADLQRIGHAVQLGAWFQKRMGLRVSVRDGSGWREVARVPDAGPIAWKEVGVMVPVPSGASSLDLRVSFMTDGWRIDAASLHPSARRGTPRFIPLESVSVDGAASDEARARMSAPDEDYLVVTPAHYLTLTFDAGQAAAEGRTFLLGAQGYYTEWIRPQWIAEATRTTPFEASDKSLMQAIALWQEVKEPMEERFFATRIPVR
jgi:hypothetical protein